MQSEPLDFFMNTINYSVFIIALYTPSPSLLILYLAMFKFNCELKSQNKLWSALARNCQVELGLVH